MGHALLAVALGHVEPHLMSRPRRNLTVVCRVTLYTASATVIGAELLPCLAQIG